MDKFASVRVFNLQPVVSGVSDAFDTDHCLDVIDVAARDNRDVDIGVVREALQYVFGFRWQCCQIRMRCNRCQSTVVIQ